MNTLLCGSIMACCRFRRIHKSTITSDTFSRLRRPRAKLRYKMAQGASTGLQTRWPVGSPRATGRNEARLTGVGRPASLSYRVRLAAMGSSTDNNAPDFAIGELRLSSPLPVRASATINSTHNSRFKCGEVLGECCARARSRLTSSTCRPAVERTRRDRLGGADLLAERIGRVARRTPQLAVGCSRTASAGFETPPSLVCVGNHGAHAR